MMINSAFLLLAIALLAWLVARGIGAHREAMALRHRLLDEAADVVENVTGTIAPDHFPVVSADLGNGGHVRIELLSDSLVTRRLPQLWLRVTLSRPVAQDGPTLGVLARPTGAEYYSLVHDMPDWLEPPDTGASSLMRGDGRASPQQIAAARHCFQTLLADPLVKELIITPRATRVMLRVSEGERAAHMFLRQAQFPLATVPAASIRTAIDLARRLALVLPASEQTSNPRAA